MNSAAKIVIALSLALNVVFAGLFFVQRNRVSSLTDSLALAEVRHAEVVAQSPRVDELQAALDDAQGEIGQLESRVAKAENLVAVLEESVDEAVTIAEGARTAADDAATAEPAAAASPMRQMIDSMDPESMATMQATSALQVGYKRLLSEWSLDPDADVAVRDVLRAAMEEHYTAMFAAMKLDSPMSADAQTEVQDAARARIRSELAGLVSAEQLAQFDEYDLDRETLYGAMDQQLAMLAPGLTPENRVLAVDVVVEELYGMQETAPEPALDNAQAQWDAQMEAFNAAEERLLAVFDEEQMRQFSGFLRQQREMLESMRAMWESDSPVAP